MKKCEVCKTKTFLDTHHIESRSFDGVNDDYNIANICPNCHRLVHKGEIVLEGRFLTTDGYRLIWHWKGEDSVTGEEPEVYLM